MVFEHPRLSQVRSTFTQGWTRWSVAIVLMVAAVPAIPGSLQAQMLLTTECGPRLHLGETTGFVAFPQGDFFCPLISDPKEPRTFASFLQGTSSAEDGELGVVGALDTNVGAIGIGDSFGLVRWAGAQPGDGLQVGISAAVFAQFDLGLPSLDFINADYVIGIPVTLRRGAFSSRLRLYHQSSHLGDEFLIREEPERINLAFESLQLILSQGLGAVRVYGGGEYLFNREPDDLDGLLGQVGAEARLSWSPVLALLAAVDMKSSEQQDWKPAWSLRTGLDAGFGGDPGHPSRRWTLLLEYYDGPSPYGQFYREDIRFYGVGIHVSL